MVNDPEFPVPMSLGKQSNVKPSCVCKATGISRVTTIYCELSCKLSQ